MVDQRSMATLGFIMVLSAAVALGTDARCRAPGCSDRTKCEDLGVTCHDCHSRLICTPLGGIVTPCWLPGHRHCSEGRCVRQPTQECLPTTEEPRPPPTSTTEEASTQPTSTQGPSSTEQPPSTSEQPTVQEI